jgi:hypothetical protein
MTVTENICPVSLVAAGQLEQAKYPAMEKEVTLGAGSATCMSIAVNIGPGLKSPMARSLSLGLFLSGGLNPAGSSFHTHWSHSLTQICSSCAATSPVTLNVKGTTTEESGCLIAA